MKINIIAFLSILILLSGCSSAPPPRHPLGTDVALAEASYSVSRSIVNLAEIAQAAHPVCELKSQPAPASYGMGQLTSVDWSGPIQPLVEQLAVNSGYRLRVLGRCPAIPVLVSVYSKNMLLADVLRDVGYQAGRRASIVVFPENRVVELRYAKN